jgi:hypothetical protein
MLKRLAGSEFCSDAHRREYQQEYSQLALGRLLQSKPAEAQGKPLQRQHIATPSVPAAEIPTAATAMSEALAVPKPPAVHEWAEPARSAANRTVSEPPPNQGAKSQPASPNPVKKAVSEPAPATVAMVQKPAPAAPQFAPLPEPEFEHACASMAPARPRRPADRLLTELPQGDAVAWENRIEIADTLTRPMERRLELREVAGTVPRIALDLNIVPPESLETESRPLSIPVEHAVPADASLWIGAHSSFAGELVSLCDFANDQFLKSDFEAPPLAASPAGSVAAEPLPPEPQPSIEESAAPSAETEASCAEPETVAPAPMVPAPEMDLTPLPVSSPGIAPGRAKPLPVFGPVLSGAGAVQIPQPNGLPLRPVMVLVAAPATAAAENGAKNRHGGILSLRSAPSIKPAGETKKSTLRSAAPSFGFTEPRPRTPAAPKTSGMRTVLAAAAGAAVLGAGIFFLIGKQGDAGLKSPPHVLADGAAGGQWIANFAPDAERQRRVSVLRSSLNRSAYRLDFESSIRIKALGWVYRAQDSKNFYVSKIEFQKPGLNPVYALVHYAVIDGVEQPRMETPLHVSVPMGGLYKIRFEAVGNRFTTWVQGERVEQWTDPQLSSGGAGLYGEGVEQSMMHGDFVVTPLPN